MSILTAKIGSKQLRIKNCKGFASVRGLMFDDMKKYQGALIYANSIWMPFVRYELDLLFIDKGCNVIDVQRAVPVTFNPATWRVYKHRKAKYCLELRAGLFRARKGMRISFKPF